MARSRKPTAEELALWREAMKAVEPLPGRALPPAAPAAPALPPAMTPAPPPRPSGIRQRLAAAPLPLPAATGPGTPGIDRRTAESFRRGRMEIEARLDLHGMRRERAHDRLTAFILESVALRRRKLLVITGKGTFAEGQAVLRSAVPTWLAEPPLRDNILAIHPARPRDGGAGALYVLLRRVRD
jgi:DNA-nicking Smr family endonuclease